VNVDSITVAAVAGGTAQGPAASFSGIALDSRACREGDLFVAIKGPKNDGHDHLVEALQKASGALVSRSVALSSLPAGSTLVKVSDTLAALRALAKYVRDTIRPKVVAVAGSVGKTTTKEMTAGLLASRFVVAKTTGNLNNTIGLPAEVARMPEGTEVAVLEMGMSTPGEVRLLSELVRPDVGVITAIAPEHMMNFKSLDGVREANAEILAGMGRESVFVANAGSSAIAKRHAGRVLRFAVDAPPGSADVVASEATSDGGSTQFLLHVGGETHVASLPLPGRHNLSNFVAAAAAATALGMSGAEIVHAALALAPSPHRGEVLSLPGDVLVYDDTYNSSPVALEAAYRAFEALAGARRKVALVGDMLELGRFAEEYHLAAGRELAGRADLLVLVGPESRRIAEGARRGGQAAGAIVECADVAAAIGKVAPEIQPGDAVFAKGSRGIALDRFVDALRKGKEGGAS